MNLQEEFESTDISKRIRKDTYLYWRFYSKFLEQRLETASAVDTIVRLQKQIEQWQQELGNACYLDEQNNAGLNSFKYREINDKLADILEIINAT